MRRLIFIAAGLVALAATGLAVANGVDGRSVKAVAGTFTATTASFNQTRTCTTTDGKAIAITKGRYQGSASGDPDLTGPVTLDARSVINTTDGVGYVEGKLRIDVASGEDTVAHFTGVYDHGKLAGVATGRVHEPRAALLGNLSAGFAAAGGFTDGKIGNSTGGSAVEIGPARCQSTKTQEGGKSEARGPVTAVSESSITVAGLTCAVPQNLAAQVTGLLHVGDRAEIRCAIVNGQNTLTKFYKKR